jgi:hypothetical protein
VGIRFDYSTKVPGYVPHFSMYLTDYVGPYPFGLAEADLKQDQGIYVGDKKIFQDGQKK